MRNLLIITIFIIGVRTLLAASPPQTTDYNKKISEEKSLLLDSEVKKRGILGALYEINKDLNKINSDINSIDHQVAGSKKTIQSYAKVIANLEQIQDSQKKLLRARLRAIYKIGLQGYTEAVLSSHTSEDFSRNVKFLKIITERDHNLIVNYKNNLEALTVEQSKLRNQIKTYVLFQKALSIDQKKFAEQKKKQILILGQIEKDREIHLQALKEWREAGRKFEERLVQLGLKPSVSTDLTRGSFIEKRGVLKPPVVGNILQKYGLIRNELFNTQVFHKGLFFEAEPGETVSSLFWGKVAFSGWINGYGETIIIDHGDHYYSVYAHNSKLEKKSGDTVVLGEAIAKAGDTGSLRGPGLYMEIRHFSESLDPLPWLDLPKATRL